MKNQNTFLFVGMALLFFCFPKNNEVSLTETPATTVQHQNKADNMKLGAFSMSLNVKDLQVSKAFYEKLGFEVLGGDEKMNYLIMKNENALIGLFQGMFEDNIITFNPGWDESGENIDDFEDVREIQRRLKDQELTLVSEADESTEGPASIVLMDPDGNMILIDQHR
jgi:catechol 2,3-dioxygenase-like lactoylglutathione lyase family enzyme